MHAQNGMGKDFLGMQHSLLFSFLFISFAQLAPLYCEEYVYTYTYGHIPQCLEIIYE